MDMKRYSTLAVLFLCFVMAAPLSAAQQSRGRWELLGRQEADFRKDHASMWDDTREDLNSFKSGWTRGRLKSETWS